MHKLDETQVEREFLLCNAPMRAKPTAQQRPEALHGIHMHFTKAITIFISSELASPMVDMLMTDVSTLFRTQTLMGFERLLIDQRSERPIGRMAALAVIKHLNIFDHGRLGQLVRLKILQVNEFGF